MESESGCACKSCNGPLGVGDASFYFQECGFWDARFISKSRIDPLWVGNVLQRMRAPTCEIEE
eukprot:1951128-Pyramimonas_sp.AAC.1